MEKPLRKKAERNKELVMTKKTNKMEEIAKLLPENLDESVAVEIANLVSEKITEEVEKVKQDLTIKTTSFIRGQIEKLKEHALKELEMENDTVKNLSVYEHIKSLMAVELNPADEQNAINAMQLESTNLSKNVDILKDEMSRVLEENNKFKNVIKIQKDKIGLLESRVSNLQTSIRENKEKAKMEVSGDAVVVSEENFKKRETLTESKTHRNPSVYNPFLNEETLNLMIKD
jgi:hypothetical protein